MPRSKAVFPKYRRHVSGQAVVDFNSTSFYLGAYESPESHARYLELVTEYHATGLQTPKKGCQQQQPLSLSAMLLDFLTNGLQRVTPSADRQKLYARLAKELDTRCGHTPLVEFGPIKLSEIRDGFVERGNSRRHANDLTNMIRRIFKWAVSRELVAAEQLVRLESLTALRRGEARDNPKRQPVDPVIVKATLPYLQPVVADMVRLQLLTGCRPSELFSLTPAEIDTATPESWQIIKDTHKTDQFGKTRMIPLVAEAQSLLQKYVCRDDCKLCFLTCKGTPWNKNTYRRNINRTCKRQNIPAWTPYQIRHFVAQLVRDNLSAEHVQAILGHSKISMVETYSRASCSKAIEAAISIAAAAQLNFAGSLHDLQDSATMRSSESQ